MLGKASYEIFLCQMLFTTIDYASLAAFDNKILAVATNVTLSWLLSLLIGLIWYNYKMKKII